jgi:hypothetical protein
MRNVMVNRSSWNMFTTANFQVLFLQPYYSVKKETWRVIYDANFWTGWMTWEFALKQRYRSSVMPIPIAKMILGACPCWRSTVWCQFMFHICTLGLSVRKIVILAADWNSACLPCCRSIVTLRCTASMWTFEDFQVKSLHFFLLLSRILLYLNITGVAGCSPVHLLSIFISKYIAGINNKIQSLIQLLPCHSDSIGWCEIQVWKVWTCVASWNLLIITSRSCCCTCILMLIPIV